MDDPISVLAGGCKQCNHEVPLGSNRASFRSSLENDCLVELRTTEKFECVSLACTCRAVFCVCVRVRVSECVCVLTFDYPHLGANNEIGQCLRQAITG